MKCGDVITVAAAGDYGKPRPSVIVQTDAFPGSQAAVASHGRQARHDPARTNRAADRPS